MVAAGVAKLTEAENLVKELKKKAAEQQNKLEEKQSKANAALDMISNTMKNANSHKEEMESLKSKTEEENKQLIKRYITNTNKFEQCMIFFAIYNTIH
ncbi:hypothetical protein NQ314_021233 [Rhamnusium bicolor]|uniref:Uncharacterized protein n=1 Tax=Rhamnusium bicolor TaxID=1586634 RepID=A0AAV8WIN4_9CUCU|nr:hypothetical protein NQ314_021233 [Rhamnusium bicolor]